MSSDWKKFEKPKTRGEWIKTVLVGLFLLALLHVFIGFPLAGWWPAYGRSAWPTMKWFTTWPYLSGYYHADYSDKNPEQGDIVWFWVPGHWPDSEIKRVEKVETRDGQQYMWLTTDNIGMTGEASSEDDDALFGWVPASRIIATVDDIWTPERWARARTPEGRHRNQTEMLFPVSAIFSDDGAWVAVPSRFDISIYSIDRRLLTRNTCFRQKEAVGNVQWRNSKFVYKVKGDWMYGAYSPSTGHTEMFKAFPTELLVLKREENRVIVMGDCRKLIQKGDMFEGAVVDAVNYPVVDHEILTPSSDQENTLVELDIRGAGE